MRKIFCAIIIPIGIIRHGIITRTGIHGKQKRCQYRRIFDPEGMSLIFIFPKKSFLAFLLFSLNLKGG